jgi:uncharacterized protein YhfF
MSSLQMTDDADRYWMQFLQSLPDNVEPPAHYIGAFSFGFSPEDAASIAQLVLNGTKTATGSVLWSYEYDKKPVPRVGDYWVVQDGRSVPVGIIQTTDVSLIPFDEVPECYAWEGGEGDRTMETWRSIYWRYIIDECERIGLEPSQKTPLIMERFKVVYSESLQ